MVLKKKKYSWLIIVLRTSDYWVLSHNKTFILSFLRRRETPVGEAGKNVDSVYRGKNKEIFSSGSVTSIITLN